MKASAEVLNLNVMMQGAAAGLRPLGTGSHGCRLTWGGSIVSWPLLLRVPSTLMTGLPNTCCCTGTDLTHGLHMS